MKKLLLLLALLFPTEAWAQCNGVFPANTLCGNLSGAPAPPSAFAASGTIAGPVSSTLNGLPIWNNTLGTSLKDGAGQTIAGNYTWGGTQTYSAAQTFNAAATFNATANFTSTFQVNTQTFTWPAAGTTVAGLGTNQTFAGNNTFTGTNAVTAGTFNWSAATFQSTGNAMTFPTSPATLPGINLAQTWTGNQNFDAGSTSLPNFQQGVSTLQTTPAAGGFEYDGTVGYFAPQSGNRGVLGSIMILTLSANQTGQNATGAQTWFPGGGATGLNVAASTTYKFEGRIDLSRSAGANNYTTQTLFGGTATITSISYYIKGFALNSSTPAVTSPTNFNVAQAATAVNASVAIASAAQWTTIEVTGIVRINGAGTFIPQFQYTVAPGGAPTVQANSYFQMQPIGSGSVLSVGNWQ